MDEMKQESEMTRLHNIARVNSRLTVEGENPDMFSHKIIVVLGRRNGGMH